jgi:integrase
MGRYFLPSRLRKFLVGHSLFGGLTQSKRSPRNGVDRRFANGWLFARQTALYGGRAVRDRIITLSPAAHLRSAKREKPIRLTPTFEQFEAIIADVRSQPFNADAQDSADFLQFLGLAGLGQAEASSLMRGDVDLTSGQIITYRHKTSTGFAIPIFPQIRPLLESLCEGKAHGERVFKISDARKALAGACRRLGYPNFSQHTLRRMFITRAIERGVDVKVIAEWQVAQGRRETDSRHLQSCEPHSFPADGTTDDDSRT